MDDFSALKGLLEVGIRFFGAGWDMDVGYQNEFPQMKIQVKEAEIDLVSSLKLTAI